MEILERIKQLRDSRGWSNYRLAKEADIAEGSLNNLFRLKQPAHDSDSGSDMQRF